MHKVAEPLRWLSWWRVACPRILMWNEKRKNKDGWAGTVAGIERYSTQDADWNARDYISIATCATTEKRTPSNWTRVPIHSGSRACSRATAW